MAWRTATHTPQHAIAAAGGKARTVAGTCARHSRTTHTVSVTRLKYRCAQETITVQCRFGSVVVSLRDTREHVHSGTTRRTSMVCTVMASPVRCHLALCTGSGSRPYASASRRAASKWPSFTYTIHAHGRGPMCERRIAPWCRAVPPPPRGHSTRTHLARKQVVGSGAAHG